VTDITDILEMRFERQPTMVTRLVAGETILVPIIRQMGEEASLYTLDEVATFLWEHLDGQHTGCDLVKALTQTYAVEAAQAEKDVRSFLEQLKSIEAIHPVTGSVPTNK